MSERSREPTLREILSSHEVGIELRASLDAIAAIGRALRSTTEIPPYVVPALEIIELASQLARYMAVVSSIGEVIEFTSGRTFEQVRTVLMNVPAEKVGSRLAAARMLLEETAAPTGSSTAVESKSIILRILRVLESGGRAISTLPPEDQQALVHQAADQIWQLCGTRPPIRIVEGALRSVTRGRGAPRKNAPAKPKKEDAINAVLMAVGHEVADVYEYARDLKREETR
jgi:hypothetical protein